MTFINQIDELMQYLYGPDLAALEKYRKKNQKFVFDAYRSQQKDAPKMGAPSTHRKRRDIVDKGY